MLTTDKCEYDSCSARLPSRSLSSTSVATIAFSSLPFFATFIILSLVVSHKLFPLLSGQQQHVPKSGEHYLPSDAPPSLRRAHDDHGSKSKRQRAAALSFSTTISLTAVLAELILCEISNTVNPAARMVALQVTVPTLLFLLIILIPYLEIQSLIEGAGVEFDRSEKGLIPRLPWILQLFSCTLWLCCFWWLGKMLPGAQTAQDPSITYNQSISNGCLDRIGVIGIALMALLSASASVSSPWYTFFVRHRPVTDTDVARKRAGLETTNEMLTTKRSRLRALQRHMSNAPQKDGFVTRVLGTLKGSADAQEIKGLSIEISGLETMAMGLSTSLTTLQTRQAAAERAATPLGKVMIIPNYGFSAYCIYRILAALFNSLRRFLAVSTSQSRYPAGGASDTSFATSDPVTTLLSLLTKHIHPTLNQAAWSQTISFLLSGVILLASFNSVLQTFHLFTRYFPSLLYQAHANAALLISQVAATYVISSALLLRGSLPREIGRVVNDALGTGTLEGAWVERWFEGWFLVGVVGTLVGIWFGRRLGGDEWDWDDYGGDVEMGQKRL